MDRFVSTQELIQMAKSEEGRLFEAAFGNATFRFTHYVQWWKGRLYDEGIDGCNVRTSAKTFLAMYPNVTWMVTT